MISSVRPSFLYPNKESAFIYYVKTKVCESSKKLKKFFTKWTKIIWQISAYCMAFTK